MTLGPLDIEPKKKVRLTIEAAKLFEKYINDVPPSESSDDSKDTRYKYEGKMT